MLTLRDMPQATPIDRSHAGVASISASFLTLLLRLPRGQQVVRIRPGADSDVLDLVIEGAGMPERDAHGAAQPVHLRGHIEVEQRSKRAALSWHHDPDHRWPLYDDVIPAEGD